jgi:hypothetical protein
MSAKKNPGFIDTFLVLLTSVALSLFVLWATSRLQHSPVFETLSDWLQKALINIWTVAIVGVGGIAIAVRRSIAQKSAAARPNYLLYIAGTTVVLLACILIVTLLTSTTSSRLEKIESADVAHAKDLAQDVRKVLASLQNLPDDVLQPLHDDIVAKLQLTKTNVPVKRIVTVFYEPNSPKEGFVKLQLIQFGSGEADNGIATHITGRSVASDFNKVQEKAFQYRGSGYVQVLKKINIGNEMLYSFQVSAGDIVAVTAVYSGRLVSGIQDSNTRADWTSVAVQELAIKPVIYDFAIASEISQVTIVDSTEFWRNNETGFPEKRKRKLAPIRVTAFPPDVLQAFHVIAAKAAETFDEVPFRDAFKTLSQSDLVSKEFAMDHNDNATYNVVYVTQQAWKKK